LPVVITVGEVHTLLKQIEKPSIRCFFTVVYALGLRLQEALNLQVADIDSKRMMVHIHRGKGAKDRMIPLPEMATLAKDPKYVGSDKLGAIAVLHTWGRDLNYHPHVHMIVPGGAISASGTQWLASRSDFLVPVRALSKIFRAKFKQLMRQAGLLEKIEPTLWQKVWNVNCQGSPPLAGHAGDRDAQHGLHLGGRSGIQLANQATGVVSGLWRPAPVLGLWRASDPESKAAHVGQPTVGDR
jgi:hypothetical protein